MLSYSRWVDASWSPKGSALAISDHAGSDYGEVYVFTFEGSPKHVRMIDLLRGAFPNDPTLFRNDHVYVETTEWLSDLKLKFRVYGHGEVDPNGFEMYFEYSIGGHVTKVDSPPIE